MRERQMINVGLASTVSCKTINKSTRKDHSWNLRTVDMFKSYMVFTIVLVCIFTFAAVLTKMTYEAQLTGDYVKIIKETK